MKLRKVTISPWVKRSGRSSWLKNSIMWLGRRARREHSLVNTGTLKPPAFITASAVTPLYLNHRPSSTVVLDGPPTINRLATMSRASSICQSYSCPGLRCFVLPVMPIWGMSLMTGHHRQGRDTASIARLSNWSHSQIEATIIAGCFKMKSTVTSTCS